MIPHSENFNNIIKMFQLTGNNWHYIIYGMNINFSLVNPHCTEPAGAVLDKCTPIERN